jgi:hypothetical protein
VNLGVERLTLGFAAGLLAAVVVTFLLSAGEFDTPPHPQRPAGSEIVPASASRGATKGDRKQPLGRLIINGPVMG